MIETTRYLEYTKIPGKLRGRVGENTNNESFEYLYVGDGYYKDEDEIIDPLKIVKDSEGYFYERGTDLLTDWLIDNGAVLGERLLILISW